MLDNLENKRLKILRQKLKMAQGDFAQRLNMKQGSYSDIERGRVDMSAHVIKKLIMTFNVNPIWLLTGKGDMFLQSTDPIIPPDPEHEELLKLQRQVAEIAQKIELIVSNGNNKEKSTI